MTLMLDWRGNFVAFPLNPGFAGIYLFRHEEIFRTKVNRLQESQKLKKICTSTKLRLSHLFIASIVHFLIIYFPTII